MLSFLAGLFVGEGKFEAIKDNLDLERWFRLPKSHERRIHGHRHAGVRIVQEGPTLVHALDAHAAHPGTVHRGRPAAVSDGPRAAEPETGAEPPQDHEEGAIQEETAVTPGRPGAALSRIAGVLALSRTVDHNCLTSTAGRVIGALHGSLVRLTKSRRRTRNRLRPLRLRAPRIR